MPPPKPSLGFSFFGSGSGARDSAKKVKNRGRSAAVPPSLKLNTDRDVYRPGDPVLVTVEICNNSPSSSPSSTVQGNDAPTSSGDTNAGYSLLIESLTFEMKGIEKLNTQWFTTQKPSPDSKQRRGEYVFMDCSVTSIVSNQIVSSGATKTCGFIPFVSFCPSGEDLVRTLLPDIIPPSYKGATICYLYYVRCTLSGEYLILDNGHSHGESSRDLTELEARIPLQIWVTQKTNGLPIEDGQSDGIVPVSTVLLDVYWKEMDADSDWARANELDGDDEGYESSRDQISPVSSNNPIKESIHRAFGSSLSLQSSIGRSSSLDASYFKERNSISSYMPLSQLSVAEVLYDTSGDVSSPKKYSTMLSPRHQLKHSKSLSTDDDLRVSPVPVAAEPVAQSFVRGRSYNIRLDDQVLLRFSPKNSDSSYYFSDMIGGTLTFFHEEGPRRCLELSVTLEMSETINRHLVHPSWRHSPTITKVLSDHHEVVADLVQTSFLFSIPMDGPMSFSTPRVSVQWSLRFELFTTPKNVDWTRFEHPLLIEGRDKCEWVLPITVHAPPLGTQSAYTRNEKPVSLDPLWVRT
ncbi:uncharacterized protein LOC127814020 isoform X2 [Diospyros lotus]|uniref:uncharacterized protein LOC127814020 isoform X2 n=1 Tax=Diospyros lotus TaxID=55363 RepID=UPI00225A9A1E|nr:uncharacterized protein LOC127814020 isoform X2 [Diospyros lotus]